MEVKPAKSLRPPPRRLVREKPKIVRSDEEEALIRARAREAEENKLDVWRKRRGSVATAALTTLEPDEVPAFALDYIVQRFWELQRSQKGASPFVSRETAVRLREIALNVVDEHVEEFTQSRVFSMTDPEAQKRRELDKQQRAIAQMKQNEAAQKDKAKEKEERARRMEEELKAAATQEGDQKTPRKKSKTKSKSKPSKEEDNEKDESPSRARKREKGSRTKTSKTKSKQTKGESESALIPSMGKDASPEDSPETTRQARAMTEGSQSRVAHRRVNRSLKTPPLLTRSGMGSIVVEQPLPVINVTTELVDLTRLVDLLEESLLAAFPSAESLPQKDENSKQFLDFYHLSVQGPRPANEDEYVVIEHVNDLIGLPYEDQYAYCGVYDGHRGKYASLYTRSQLHSSIFTHPQFPQNEAFHDSFMKTDTAVNAVQHRDGFLCGTTALSVCIRNNEELIVANAGDCRGFICRNGKPFEIADRHIPNRPDEMERIKGLGGIVVCFGTWRVNGSLAVSRSIGDLDSRSLVVADPEITRIPIQEEDEFLVLASDGLWDEVTGEDMIQIVKQTVATKGRNHVCQVLCDTGVERNTKDNVTVITLFFDHSHKK